MVVFVTKLLVMVVGSIVQVAHLLSTVEQSDLLMAVLVVDVAFLVSPALSYPLQSPNL